MSRQQKDSHELTVKEVSTTLKDTSADLEFLMVQLGVPLSHVRHLLITSPSSDGVLVKCLDYWLKRSEDPKWEDVIKALEGSGDNNLASRIRRKILQSDAIPICREKDKEQLKSRIGSVSLSEYYQEWSYSNPDSGKEQTKNNEREQPDFAECNDLEILKRSVTHQYNEAAKKVEEFYVNVKETLKNEQAKVREAVVKHQSKTEEFFRNLDIDIKDQLDTACECESQLTNALERLKSGDSSALAVLEENQDRLISLEKENGRLELCVQREDRKIPKSSESLSTSQRVQEDLKNLLKVVIKTKQTNTDNPDDVYDTYTLI